MHLFVVNGFSEVHLDIGFNYANLILWLALHDIDQVVSTVILNVDGVTLHKTSIVGKLLFKDSFGVCKVDERGLMGLEGDKSSLLEVNIAQNDFRTLLEE